MWKSTTDLLQLPDVVLEKITSHLNLLERISLSVVSKASQRFFNAAENPWDTLALIADSRSHKVCLDHNNHRVVRAATHALHR